MSRSSGTGVPPLQVRRREATPADHHDESDYILTAKRKIVADGPKA